MEDLLGPRVFTNREKAAAIEREIKQRKYVYPRRVRDGKMKEETAAREIATMVAILADYQGKP